MADTMVELPDVSYLFYLIVYAAPRYIYRVANLLCICIMSRAHTENVSHLE